MQLTLTEVGGGWGKEASGGLVHSMSNVGLGHFAAGVHRTPLRTDRHPTQGIVSHHNWKRAGDSSLHFTSYDTAR